MSWLFKIALGVDCIGVLIGLYFILTDSINSPNLRNGPLSIVTLGMCGWIGICYYLNTHDYERISTIMAWIPATPMLGYGLMLLAFLIGKPDFK